jgi:hypothetical protein
MHSIIANGRWRLDLDQAAGLPLARESGNGARRDCGGAFRAAAAGGLAQVIHERREIGAIAISFKVNPFGGRRLLAEANIRVTLRDRADGPWHERATAIQSQLKHLLPVIAKPICDKAPRGGLRPRRAFQRLRHLQASTRPDARHP